MSLSEKHGQRNIQAGCNMKNALLVFLFTASIPLFAAETAWSPVKDATLNGKPIEDLTIPGLKITAEPTTLTVARQPLVTQANCVTEVTLTTEKTYSNPFMEITLDALVTAPDGRQFKVPAFWAGGNAWRFRYASGSIGTHTYRTECSDTTNPRLHGVEGKIEVVAYRGKNPLYRHGPIRVAKDRRHFGCRRHAILLAGRYVVEGPL